MSDELADWGVMYGEELYNHTCNTEDCTESFDTETHNIAQLDSSRAVRQQMLAQLKSFNTKRLSKDVRTQRWMI